MKKGEKIIYGYNDKENMIYCTYTGEYKITPAGDIIITAVTEDGKGKIIADINLFQRMNSMCNNCKRLDNGCCGCFNPIYTGCISKISDYPTRTE